MNIQEIETKQKKFKDGLALSQRIQGEEAQIIQEKDVIMEELKDAGFLNRQEVENAKLTLETQIVDIITKIEA